MMGQTVSHYKIVERLGAGGMGVVYRAFDTRLDRIVALKFLTPHLAASEAAKERFLSEARAASAIDHPNIATIHEIGETPDGGVFIVMAYYPGPTLRDKLLGGPLPVETALEIAIQVTRGLGKAHERGIVHRDVKPPNLLLTDGDVVKIVDFGLAKMAGIHLTSGGAALGTPAYMSPEQVRGEPVDQRCDIWALGVVLWEMLAGRLPFQGRTEHAVFEAILHQPIPPLRVPSGGLVENAIRRAVEKRREDRYPTMESFADILSGVLGRPKPSPGPELETRVRPGDSGRGPASRTAGAGAGALPATAIPCLCLQCGVENPAGMSFCGQCGRPLARRCPQCGVESDPKARFCGSCGLALGAPSERSREDSHPSGEQRQLTALACELSDFASLSNWFEPEELGEILTGFRRRSTELIERFDGHVAQYVGDGFLAYFGYPRAHEDDAHRAVKSAMALVEALAEPNRELGRRAPPGHDSSLRVRVGIHTGRVITGIRAAGAQSDLVLGNVPSVASKIQQRARPNEILASPETTPLIRKHFELHYTGSYDLPGLASPMRLYRVDGERDAGSRSAADRALSTGEPVGRQQEIELLWSRWEKVESGIGQVVLVSGEPGIGKSRLVQAFLGRLVGTKPAIVECHASPFFANTPLHPVAEGIKRLVGSAASSSFEGLLSLLSTLGVPLPESVPFLAPLLGVSCPDEYRAPLLAPNVQKQKVLESILGLLSAMAAERPLVFLVEDLHWIDPSTRELIELLVDQGPVMRSLTLLSFRPDFQSPWTGRPNVTHITLDRLSDDEVARLVDQIAIPIAGESLDPAFVREIQRKSDGVPLYAEELTRMLVESNEDELRDDRASATRAPGVSKVPSTLLDSLTARLDRLGEAKTVAQLAATIGREFSYDLLKAVSLLEEGALRSELGKLVKATLLFQRGLPPKATFTFKHALVQEAAYGSLLKSTRQLYHSQIAEILTARFPRVAAAQPEVLAHHYTAAGRLEDAVTSWLQAGRQALGRSASQEAVNHLRTGLALSSSLPEGGVRDRLELAFQMTLSGALSGLMGYGANEVAAAQERARELCDRIGPSPDQLPVMQGLFAFATARSQVARASEYADELLALAREVPEYAREGHYAVGVSRFFRGEWADSFRHLELGAPRSADADHSGTSGTGMDNAVGCLTFIPPVLWMMGRSDRAREAAENALANARRRAHPLTLASALYIVGFFHQYLGNWGEVRSLGREMEELARERGFLIWELGGRIAQATADFGTSSGSDLEIVRASISGLRATGLIVWSNFYLAELGRMYLASGRLAEAKAALEEARELVEGGAERFWRPEIHRLQGELARADGNVEQAVELVREALELANASGSQSLALRAATTLASLGGPTEPLRKLIDELRPLGDTLDLKRAAAVLREGEDS
jgi:class 3 adenylate cyclase/tetratricopeptide (TPR) repeat protein